MIKVMVNVASDPRKLTIAVHTSDHFRPGLFSNELNVVGPPT